MTEYKNDLEKVLDQIHETMNEKLTTRQLYDAIIQALNDLGCDYDSTKLILIFDTLVDRLMSGEDL